MQMLFLDRDKVGTGYKFQPWPLRLVVCLIREEQYEGSRWMLDYGRDLVIIQLVDRIRVSEFRRLQG